MKAWNAAATQREGVPVLAPGHVWLAGAGPGDPGLLTLDALTGLAHANVVVHDALVDRRILALAGPQARLEFAGKRGGKPSATQTDISQRLIELAHAKQRVLRLKGGDPCLFGRGGEEAMALAAAGVPFRIIPAGHGAEDDAFDWAPLARAGQPIVLYMVMHNLEKITQALMRGGIAPATPAAVIASATTPEERILVSTIDRVAADARAQGFEPPAIVVVGEIVAVRERLSATADKAAR
jgi:uroporphyrin-III C-methyltransferase